MLKLMKYEYKKNRIMLLLLAAVTAALELFFLGTVVFDDMGLIPYAIILLALAAVISFTIVLIFGITNYKSELNSKSCYLIFMTPNSSLKIILSKMLYILALSIVTVIVFTGLMFIDLSVLMGYLGETIDMSMIKEVFTLLLDMAGVDTQLVGAYLLVGMISSVVGMFSIFGIAYLAITLSKTVLNNNKYNGILSFVFFIILMIIVSVIDNKFIGADISDNANVFLNLLPTLLYNGIVLVLTVIGSSALIDRAINL